jgi:uncharacterized protein YdeI (YjbR/CyaY-like superfamily)
MPNTDPRVDAYITSAPAFAQPILERARAVVHEACPQVEETLKWGMPTFMHAGGILCGMAAFKQHATFGFWKHALVMGGEGERAGMGSFGKMTSVRDLPPKKQLVALVRKAMALNEQGVKTPQARKRGTRPPADVPADLSEALRVNDAARETFERFPPSQRREYIEWLEEAKREETRRKRLAQAVEWLAEGKQRNWKYMKS